MQVKRIDFNKNSFTAGGVEYFIARSLTVSRFMEFEKYQNHVGFGFSFSEVYEKLTKVYKHLDKNEQNEPRIILHNLLNGIKDKLENRVHPALMMCTLFINEKDEDVSEWNEDIATRKIENWNKEGIDVADFFTLAINLVDGYLEICEQLTQSSSKIEKKAKDIIGKE
jgi:hypothetical protein